MPQRANGLTAAEVDKGAALGRFGDGGGLYLLVRSREAKFWLFRYTRHGKTREMGLGPASGRAAVKLAQARVKARELHAIVRKARSDGRARGRESQGDAESKRRPARSASRRWRTCTSPRTKRSWRNPKHRQQWRNTSLDYVLLAIGETPVGASTPARSRRSSNRCGERKPKRRRVCAGASRRSSITPRRAAGAKAKTRPAGAAISINSYPRDRRCSASNITRRSTGARSARSWRGSGG